MAWRSSGQLAVRRCQVPAKLQVAAPGHQVFSWNQFTQQRSPGGGLTAHCTHVHRDCHRHVAACWRLGDTQPRTSKPNQRRWCQSRRRQLSAPCLVAEELPQHSAVRRSLETHLAKLQVMTLSAFAAPLTANARLLLTQRLMASCKARYQRPICCSCTRPTGRQLGPSLKAVSLTWKPAPSTVITCTRDQHRHLPGRQAHIAMRQSPRIHTCRRYARAVNTN